MYPQQDAITTATDVWLSVYCVSGAASPRLILNVQLMLPGFYSTISGQFYCTNGISDEGSGQKVIEILLFIGQMQVLAIQSN